jgi:uncharacterized protein (UPF0548 family)
MLLSLRKPTPLEIRAFLDRQRGAPFSYPDVGATRSTLPPGWAVDHNRIRLGQGRADFEAACAAVRRWEMFRIGWVEIQGADAPPAAGMVVGPLAHVFGVWFLNACRVVYVIEEERRFGLAYGTLPAHAESGEERFSVEWREEDDSVWYDLLAFSRPGHWLTRLGQPVVRRLQKRFAKASMAAMERAVKNPLPVPPPRSGRGRPLP